MNWKEEALCGQKEMFSFIQLKPKSLCNLIGECHTPLGSCIPCPQGQLQVLLSECADETFHQQQLRPPCLGLGPDLYKVARFLVHSVFLFWCTLASPFQYQRGYRNHRALPGSFVIVFAFTTLVSSTYVPICCFRNQ